MKKIRYSSVALLLLATAALASTNEKDTPKTQGIEIVDGWEISGDIRAGWVQYDYQNKPTGIDAKGDIVATDPSLNQVVCEMQLRIRHRLGMISQNLELIIYG